MYLDLPVPSLPAALPPASKNIPTNEPSGTGFVLHGVAGCKGLMVQKIRRVKGFGFLGASVPRGVVGGLSTYGIIGRVSNVTEVKTFFFKKYSSYPEL